MGSSPAESNVVTWVWGKSGSGPTDFPDLPFQHDSVVFGPHSGRLATLREVAEDDPNGEFADLLDSIDVRQVADATDSEEKNIERTGTTYVAMDDKVGWVRRKRRAVMPDERSTSAQRVTALESALTGFAERDSETVVTPSLDCLSIQ